MAWSTVVQCHGRQLATARKLVASKERPLWMSPWETPKCSELRDNSESYIFVFGFDAGAGAAADAVAG